MIKLGIILLSISYISILVLSDKVFLSYTLLSLSFVLLVYSIIKKQFKLKVIKKHLRTTLLISIISISSTLITVLISTFIPSSINLSNNNPNSLSPQDYKVINSIRQEIYIYYFSPDLTSETLFKKILTKISSINHKIKFRVLRQIIDDNKYFKLNNKYPAFVLNSILLESKDKTKIIPSFHSKEDIISGLRLLVSTTKNICIYTKDTKEISILLRILQNNSYNIFFNLHKTCSTVIIYDKTAKVLPKNLDTLLAYKKIIVFTSIQYKNRIQNLLNYLKTDITTCANSKYYAIYTDTFIKHLKNFTLESNTLSCIEYNNYFYKKFFNKIILISDNYIDNRLIEFKDNARFILSLIEGWNINKQDIEKATRALSPRSLHLLSILLLVYITTYSVILFL